MMNFDGKVVVITGGARGIGEACAWAFLEHGADVLLADINIERAQDTAQKMREKYPERRVGVFQINTKFQAECFAMADHALRELGRVDILVNSAGITSQKPSLEVSEEDWNNLIGINLSGVFFCAQAAARAMIEAQHGGVIISLSSIAAEAALPKRASYNAAKAAINQLTKTLAVEWASLGIRVNAVAPTWVSTDILAGSIQKGLVSLDKLTGAIPLGRVAEVEDIANAILFLASDAASMITGQTLYVDGGFIAGAPNHAIR
jgi:NAD(P)-dependent dehydrogenase (short-subunit alcohol dehydrogenase family)